MLELIVILSHVSALQPISVAPIGTVSSVAYVGCIHFECSGPLMRKRTPQIVDHHPDTDVGVFFCGPAVLSKTYVPMLIPSIYGFVY
jgi:hypothetical protein